MLVTTIMLTYGGVISRSLLHNKFQYLYRNIYRDLRVFISHENRDNIHTYTHTHVILYFGTSIIFDPAEGVQIYKIIRDNIDIFPDMELYQEMDSWKVCMKHVMEKFNMNHVAEYIWKSENYAKYLRYYCKIQDTKLNQYQFLWWNMLQSQDNISILWVADFSIYGKIGKTRFMEWLSMVHKASQFSPNVDIDKIEYKYEYACVFIKRNERMKVNYENLEKIKDKLSNMDKYCKMIVFANFTPDIDIIEHNRWNVITYE